MNGNQQEMVDAKGVKHAFKLHFSFYRTVYSSPMQSGLKSSRGAASERSPRRKPWEMHKAGQAPAGATETTSNRTRNFCRLSRGLLVFPPQPTAYAVGYALTHHRCWEKGVTRVMNSTSIRVQTL